MLPLRAPRLRSFLESGAGIYAELDGGAEELFEGSEAAFEADEG